MRPCTHCGWLCCSFSRARFKGAKASPPDIITTHPTCSHTPRCHPPRDVTTRAQSPSCAQDKCDSGGRTISYVVATVSKPRFASAAVVCPARTKTTHARVCNSLVARCRAKPFVARSPSHHRPQAHHHCTTHHVHNLSRAASNAGAVVHTKDATKEARVTTCLFLVAQHDAAPCLYRRSHLTALRHRPRPRHLCQSRCGGFQR